MYSAGLGTPRRVVAAAWRLRRAGRPHSRLRARGGQCRRPGDPQLGFLGLHNIPEVDVRPLVLYWTWACPRHRAAAGATTLPGDCSNAGGRGCLARDGALKRAFAIGLVAQQQPWRRACLVLLDGRRSTRTKSRSSACGYAAGRRLALPPIPTRSSRDRQHHRSAAVGSQFPSAGRRFRHWVLRRAR